jgi:hypothetical protein
MLVEQTAYYIAHRPISRESRERISTVLCRHRLVVIATKRVLSSLFYFFPEWAGIVLASRFKVACQEAKIIVTAVQK